ncbi:anti-sigma factor family protein [Indioceanicola profundi]|uniref:anti-sigma factor family protein n=1 Tax=Indioceanicola profundi TaxID=2220096 RepID=UPI001CEC2867|nr:NepR family anti-sigma factor [Indioceanicola profundi]
MRKLTMQDINAYLDGALSDEERLEIETVLARDPAAQSMVNRYRRQVDELRRIYDPVMDEPVPENMLSLLRSGSSKNTKD